MLPTPPAFTTAWTDWAPSTPSLNCAPGGGSFIAEYNAEAASDLVRLLRDKCQELVRFPNMGRARSELAPGLRSIPAGSYVIFYADADDGVEIVRILAGARDLDAFF